jgi:hypothetical protein
MLMLGLSRSDGEPVSSAKASEALLRVTAFCEEVGLQVGGGYRSTHEGESPENSQERRIAASRTFLGLSLLDRIEKVKEDNPARPAESTEWLFELAVEKCGGKLEASTEEVERVLGRMREWASTQGLQLRGVIQAQLEDSDLEAAHSGWLLDLATELDRRAQTDKRTKRRTDD